MSVRQKERQKQDRQIKVPHTLALIAIIMVLVAVATYIVPSGTYERIVNEEGKTVVVEGSYHVIERNPQGVFEVLQAPIHGIVAGAEIIAFLFIVGGAFNIIARTNAIDFGIRRIVKVFQGKEILIIPILVFTFSLAGATIGMAEEAIPFVTILVPLMLALGYDSILAVAITYFSCILGFSSAMLNTFTVGVAQSIADIPLFSGLGFRTIVWFITTLAGAIFIVIYAMRVKKNPKLSPVYESDQIKRQNLEKFDISQEEFKTSHKICLLLLGICLGVIVWGVLKQGFWITQIAAVFFATGLLCGIISRLGVDEICNAFIDGAKGMVGAALMLGFARAIVILAENANIIDTILNSLSSVLSRLPALLSAYIMYPIQMFINFFVNSGSGQAALTIPILAPLGDLVGISRQLTVFIFQLGDGFSNSLFPTSGVLLACLGLAGVPYSKWFKWVLPIQGILFAIGIISITVAYFIGWC